METVTAREIDALMEGYRAKGYQNAFPEEMLETVRYQAREEIAIKKMLDEAACVAFSNTFENLYGMKQLPGLATQDLMAQGYGYGGEGDWKVAALTAVMKAMGEGLGGGTSFMEDYTYDMKNGLSLGAHMLEVCPSIAAESPRIEVHALGIGGKEAPARLVFEGKSGDAIMCTLIDMGDRFRMIAHDVTCVKPTQTMPNLPVARVMWRPAPDLARGAESWIIAGGAHHSVLSFDCDAGMMADWARIMGIEFIHIDAGTEPERLERELLISDVVWRGKC